jgi:hypothetical protein
VLKEAAAAGSVPKAIQTVLAGTYALQEASWANFRDANKIIEIGMESAENKSLPDKEAKEVKVVPVRTHAGRVEVIEKQSYTGTFISRAGAPDGERELPIEDAFGAYSEGQLKQGVTMVTTDKTKTGKDAEEEAVTVKTYWRLEGPFSAGKLEDPKDKDEKRKPGLQS